MSQQEEERWKEFHVERFISELLSKFIAETESRPGSGEQRNAVIIFPDIDSGRVMVTKLELAWGATPVVNVEFRIVKRGPNFLTDAGLQESALKVAE